MRGSTPHFPCFDRQRGTYSQILDRVIKWKRGASVSVVVKTAKKDIKQTSRSLFFILCATLLVLCRSRKTLANLRDPVTFRSAFRGHRLGRRNVNQLVSQTY